MISVCRNICKLRHKNCSIRFISSLFLTKNSISISDNKYALSRTHSNFNPEFNCFFNLKANLNSTLESTRSYSKKKGSKRSVEIEEESDSDDEVAEAVDDEFLVSENIITRSVPSMRLDAIMKSGFGISKKKVEQEFYAFKLRVNGQAATKKATFIHVGDELDLVRGFSPSTSKYLIVDRIIIKGIDNITATGNYPVKMEIFKELTIENYEEPWNPSSIQQLDD